MAYPSPFNHNNRSPQLTNEQHRSPWLSRDQPRHQNNISVSSNIPPPASILEPESEDSDVSNIDGDFSSAFALPINLPPAPPKQALEDPGSISAHLHELERVEDHNVKKQKRLQEKRKRKDDKIAYQRAIQDEKIKAIMDARVRRDSRIKQRRDRENIAYTRFFEELEEVETRLRQRLKRLKRGLPIEDPAPTSRRVSMNSTNSMSPSGPSYSTIPPPAKRHQTSHPGTTDLSLLNRAHDPSPYAAPPATQPSYQFYPSTRPQPPPHQPLPQSLPQSQYQPQPPPQQQPPHPPQTAPYHPNPIYAPSASPTLPPTANIAPPRHELNPYPPAGTHGSPHLSKVPPQNNTPHHPPPRHPSANYDTRPPPPPGPPSSGFATINQPPSTGFSAVNSRPAATPPIAHNIPVLEHVQEQQSTSVDRTPSRGPPSEEKSVSGGNGTNKRTPSTTHPYQMSEAFANRHHHCERIDTLNRGIWTWYGPSGTSENAGNAPVEMYLKCNHDGCGRIDWRTVHGLQCHIVKNHEQPKGTIGSLEKALERYGVPVSVIEEIERRDGLGSGGTMADPKNIRIKSRMRDSGDRMDFARRHTPSSVQKSHPTSNMESPSPFNAPLRSNHDMPTQPQQYREHIPKEGSVHSPIDLEKPPQIPRPTGGFAAINSWPGVNTMQGNLYNNNKTEFREVPTPAQIETTQPNRQPPAREVLGSSLPPWQTPPEALRPVMQNSPIPTDRISYPSGLHSGDKAEVTDNRPTANAEKLGPSEIFRDTATSNDRRPPEVQHQFENSNIQKVLPVEVETETTNAQTENKSSETQDAIMTDVKAEEGISNDLEKKPKDIEPAQNHGPDQLEQQDVSPRTTTEGSSVQNTPRRRREEGRKDETPKNPDQDHTRAISTEDDARMILRSPEVPHKRAIPSRRESRRSSMATAASSRLSTEKLKEDDNETVSTINTASKADSIDDDSDSITVAPRVNIDRQKDRERGKDIPKRQANGRYARKERR